MQYRLDKTLKFCVDLELSRTECGRRKPDKRLLSSILIEFEAVGAAMRYVDRKGRIAWKATPKLLEEISDDEAEAEDDLEEDW